MTASSCKKLVRFDFREMDRKIIENIDEEIDAYGGQSLRHYILDVFYRCGNKLPNMVGSRTPSQAKSLHPKVWKQGYLLGMSEFQGAINSPGTK